MKYILRFKLNIKMDVLGGRSLTKENCFSLFLGAVENVSAPSGQSESRMWPHCGIEIYSG